MVSIHSNTHSDLIFLLQIKQNYAAARSAGLQFHIESEEAGGEIAVSARLHRKSEVERKHGLDTEVNMIVSHETTSICPLCRILVVWKWRLAACRRAAASTTRWRHQLASWQQCASVSSVDRDCMLPSKCSLDNF